MAEQVQVAEEMPKHREKSEPRRWTQDEDERLQQGVRDYGEANWKAIAMLVSTRNHTQCLQRWRKVLCPGLKKGQWTANEDAMLVALVSQGFKNWGQLATHMPGRTSKQCRERWCHHLDPSIKKGNYTEEEDAQICEMQGRIGNRWSQIAQMMPGRTENAVKIRWKAIQRSKKNAKNGKPRALVRSRYSPDKRRRTLEARALAISTMHESGAMNNILGHNGQNEPKTTVPKAAPTGTTAIDKQSSIACVVEEGPSPAPRVLKKAKIEEDAGHVKQQEHTYSMEEAGPTFKLHDTFDSEGTLNTSSLQLSHHGDPLTTSQAVNVNTGDASDSARSLLGPLLSRHSSHNHSFTTLLCPSPSPLSHNPLQLVLDEEVGPNNTKTVPAQALDKPKFVAVDARYKTMLDNQREAKKENDALAEETQKLGFQLSKKPSFMGLGLTDSFGSLSMDQITKIPAAFFDGLASPLLKSYGENDHPLVDMEPSPLHFR
ncbi:unnamed protein product [Chrysoparadoxa australica]